MRSSLGLAMLVALAFAQAASAQDVPIKKHGLLSYGLGLAEAHVSVGDKSFAIYVHSKDNSLLIQPRIAAMASASGIGEWFLKDYRAAAEQFLSPVGCGVQEMHVITKAGESWEGTYICPPGVDLRQLVKEQRSQLRAGEALRPSRDSVEGR